MRWGEGENSRLWIGADDSLVNRMNLYVAESFKYCCDFGRVYRVGIREAKWLSEFVYNEGCPRAIISTGTICVYKCKVLVFFLKLLKGRLYFGRMNVWFGIGKKQVCVYRRMSPEWSEGGNRCDCWVGILTLKVFVPLESIIDGLRCICSNYLLYGLSCILCRCVLGSL